MIFNTQTSGDIEPTPSNWNDKRSMPLLPWLPASKKKRFPVAKRSPKINGEITSSPENNQKVSHDLQGIFGSPAGKNDDGGDPTKKKRSTGIVPPVLDAMKENKVVDVHEKIKQKRDAPGVETEESDTESGKYNAAIFPIKKYSNILFKMLPPLVTDNEDEGMY